MEKFTELLAAVKVTKDTNDRINELTDKTGLKKFEVHRMILEAVLNDDYEIEITKTCIIYKKK